MRQRARKEKGKLPEDRVQKLEEIGFDSESQAFAVAGDAQWKKQFKELKKFKKKNGHCDVPPFTSLANWCASQRKARFFDNAVGCRTLNQEKIDRLDKVGFIWKPIDKVWNTMFKKLKQYKTVFGDCLVPERYEEDKSLAFWVVAQRRLKKKGQLSFERATRLDNLGFVWSVKEKKEQAYSQSAG